MKLKCQHCKYEWEYTGNANHYASCPRCVYKVNIEKQQIDKGG